MYIFNNINISSKPHIIKIFSKSNMAIVQIDIWNSQSGTIAKTLINRCFNIGSFVATIHNANMNPSILQYRNCWKWRHTTFACHLQGAKCLKCNRPHKIKHHYHFAWCCKANFKINPFHLKTKLGKLCLHSFKYINYKGDHQADSNSCSFQSHYFNREWHTKKYQELCDSRSQSIYSVVNGRKQ